MANINIYFQLKKFCLPLMSTYREPRFFSGKYVSLHNALFETILEHKSLKFVTPEKERRRIINSNAKNRTSNVFHEYR